MSDEELSLGVHRAGYPDPLGACLLHALAQQFGPRGRIAVEIGSFRGASTAMLAMGMGNAQAAAPILSIDPHAEQPVNAEQVRVTLRQIGEEARLIQARMSSDAAACLLSPASAGLVYVDGDHSFDQVRRDFEHYAPLIAEGGCLAFHDYGFGAHTGREDHFPGVTRVIDDFVRASGDFLPLILTHTLFAFQRR